MSSWNFRHRGSCGSAIKHFAVEHHSSCSFNPLCWLRIILASGVSRKVMVSQPPLLIADEIVALGAFGSWLYCDVHVGVRLGHKPDPLSREVYFFFAMGFFALGFFALGFFALGFVV